MENKKTEIDIILPNYNSYDYIDKTILSVLKQSFANWKLIIIDDSSQKIHQCLTTCHRLTNL